VSSLVVLIGPPGSGKSAWAARVFRAEQVLSSDALRAMVGEGEHDQRAGGDAFDILHAVLERRLQRRLLTVIDSLGSDAGLRRQWLELARSHGVSTMAVIFDVGPADMRARNRARERPVPADVLKGQLARWPEVKASVGDDGFDAVVDAGDAGDAVLVPDALAASADHAARQWSDPVPLDFHLQIPRFSWEGSPALTAERLRAVAVAAEEAGFSGLWVMDHFLQIPQVGREWEDMLESYTALGFLAAATTRVSLGTLVTGITYRNVGHLGKIVATLDVLSGGRAWCGVGAAWFEREHDVYGWRFPPIGERYELLEDALQLFPLLWGPGSPAFEGTRVRVPEAICYPRPLQERIPILVGGSGERRTLRLVAQYADACNLFGDATTVARKVDVLHGHCKDLGRDPASVRVTHLSTALVAEDHQQLAAIVDRLRPKRRTPESYAAAVNAGTVDEQVGRFRELADAGVQTAIVNFPDLGDVDPLVRFAKVIAAFH